MTFDGPLSPVPFKGKTGRIAAILNDSCSNAALFLGIPDCVAERVGFESEQKFNPKDLTDAGGTLNHRLASTGTMIGHGLDTESARKITLDPSIEAGTPPPRADTCVAATTHKREEKPMMSRKKVEGEVVYNDGEFAEVETYGVEVL